MPASQRSASAAGLVSSSLAPRASGSPRQETERCPSKCASWFHLPINFRCTTSSIPQFDALAAVSREMLLNFGQARSLLSSSDLASSIGTYWFTDRCLTAGNAVGVEGQRQVQRNA